MASLFPFSFSSLKDKRKEKEKEKGKAIDERADHKTTKDKRRIEAQEIKKEKVDDRHDN